MEPTIQQKSEDHWQHKLHQLFYRRSAELSQAFLFAKKRRDVATTPLELALEMMPAFVKQTQMVLKSFPDPAKAEAYAKDLYEEITKL